MASWCDLRTVLAAAALLAQGCGPPALEAEQEHGLHAAHAIHALQQRSLLRLQGLQLEDPTDLRPGARQILARLHYQGWNLPHPPGQPMLTTLPQSIKVWRRSLGGSDSCSGQVDVIALEDYVKGVLPHEWISSWQVESLRAGAVAIRTYAVAWIRKGGKYTCADLCDTTYSQVYKDSTLPKTNQAVDATKGQVLVQGSSVVFAEYSAENGDPTKSGVSDPVCAGETLYGHGRGMCQWGSHRWAQQGKGFQWIALHYYPGSTLWSSSGPAPTPDSGAPPPQADGGAPPPQADAGVSPPQRPDKGAVTDGGGPGWTDGASPPLPLRRPGTLTGGCSVGRGSAPSPWLLLALLLPLRRRRR